MFKRERGEGLVRLWLSCAQRTVSPDAFSYGFTIKPVPADAVDGTNVFDRSSIRRPSGVTVPRLEWAKLTEVKMDTVVTIDIDPANESESSEFSFKR